MSGYTEQLPKVIGQPTATVERRPRLAYTVGEAAESLGVSDQLVYNLIANGTLPAVRLGRRVLIRPADLKALMRRPEREARA